VTVARFDELIHAPTRLEIVSLLATVEWADFTFIRDEVGLSDSALSKQLTTLEAAGYLEIRKAFVGKRPRTSARLTKEGRPGRIRAARRSTATDRRTSRRLGTPPLTTSAASHARCRGTPRTDIQGTPRRSDKGPLASSEAPRPPGDRRTA
jgi:DNA-binding transcriptional ArsR family regulator